MQNIPELSICIPTYNRADLLEYCLENLRALDDHNIDYEVVVLNHASEDHTAQILEKLQQKWDNLRVYHQKKQVHIAGNWMAVMRLARGEIVMGLADDDKLITDKLIEYVRYMQKHKDVAVTYTPWLAYDDDAEKEIHGYFDVPERTEFDANQGFELFTFMVQRGLYPEIAIYRREALLPVMFTHTGAGYPQFILSCELLKQGKVIFQPDEYYLEVAKVKPQFKRESRLNLEMTLTYLDNTRAGLEVMLMRIIQSGGGNAISQTARNNMHEVLLNYLLDRLQVAFTRAVVREDYLSASELAQRIMLWRGPFRKDLQKIAETAVYKAGVQAVGWLFEVMSWKEEIILYGFEQNDKIGEILKADYPDIILSFMDKDEVLSEKVDAEKAVLFVKYSAQKDEFKDKFLLGQIISLEEAAAHYKFYPMNYSLEAA